MKKLKENVSSIALAVIIIILTVISMIVKMKIAEKCIETNAPFYILLYSIADCLNPFILIIPIGSILSLLITTKLKERFESASEIKLSVILILIISVISGLFPVKNKYNSVEINGKTPSIIQYNYALLCDVLKTETDKIVVNSHDVQIINNPYTISGGRGGSSHTYSAYNFSYDNYTAYLFDAYIDKYITLCKKTDKDIEIEYYKKSGNIITIDGIEIYSREKINSAVDKIENAIAEKQAEEDAIKEEEERKQLELFSAFFNSEGENYEDIIKSLKIADIEYTYKTVYISTQYYNIGEVAFFDNCSEERKVYVVHDNDGEDMIEIPPLPYEGTFTEITKILDENGIKWEFDCFSHDLRDTENLDHSNDTLNTVHCSPGTPVPKDYTFWFSVNHKLPPA